MKKMILCVLVAVGVAVTIFVRPVATLAAEPYTLINLPGGHCSSGDLIVFRISHLSGRYVCLTRNY